MCLKRHYYVSEEERAEMISRRQRKEVALEVQILKAIAVREDVLRQVGTRSDTSEVKAALTSTCMRVPDCEQVLQEAAALHKRSLLQVDPTAVLSQDALQPLLLLLDRMRLATVRTVEVSSTGPDTATQLVTTT